MKYIAAILTLLVSAASVQAAEMWTCHVPETSVKILKEEMVSLRGRQVVIQRIDRNADGSQDSMFVYDYNQGKKATFPRAYIYDKDFDGRPDVAYEDEQGNGICQQMTEVPLSVVLSDGSEREA